MTEKISILLAGSRPDMGEDLRGVLGGEDWIDIVGTSDSQKEIAEMAEKLSPQIIVVDFDFAGNGLEASKKLLEICPHSKVIVLSHYDRVGKINVREMENREAHILTNEDNEDKDNKKRKRKRKLQ